MSPNFKANPVVAKNFTRPGESSEYTGTRNVVGLLPSIFRTNVNTQFLNSTLEQLMTSGSLQAINSYIGSSKIGMSVTDRYVDSVSKNQFAPGVINRDSSNNITGTLTYDDMLNALKFNDAQVEQPNRALNESGYTLDLPINYDMFVNFHRYFWLIDYLPACILEPTGGNPIVIDDIIGQIYYTTPTLSNSKTLEFGNGMRVSFTGANASGTDYEVDALYIVDGVGEPTGIVLTKQFNVSGGVDPFGSKVWRSDTIYRADYKATTYTDTVDPEEFAVREYVVEQRYSLDQSAWSRTNLWVKESIVHDVCNYTGLEPTDYAIDEYRATRPIIEYRANIEKFNFGHQHILTVDHMLDSVTNPATQIATQTSWDLASYTITNEWTSVGYNKGDQVKVTMGASVTYWDCTNTHAVGKNPTQYENNDYWRKVTAEPLVNGDRILFINTTTTYNKKIFVVSGVGSNIQLALDYSPVVADSVNLVEADDKVLVVHGYNSVFFDSYDGYIYSGSEWYWDGVAWIYGQQKEMRNASLLVNLYDTDAVLLDNDATYPLSTFVGDRIFDYARGNGLVDEALGFAPEYVDYGNNPGFRFDLGLGAKRHYYNIVNSNQSYQPNNDASSLEEIKGYYYYTRLDTGLYYNGWVNLRNDQPINAKIRYVISSTTETPSFDINTDNISLNNKYRFIFDGDSDLKIISENTLNDNSKHTEINGTNPVLFMRAGATYIIQTHFSSADLEFVNLDGTAITGVTRTSLGTDLFSIALSAGITAKAFVYRLVSDNSVKGVVYVDTSANTTNLKMYKDGIESTDYTIAGSVVSLTSTHAINTVIDLVWHTTDVLTNPLIEYNVADTHIMNPQNEWLASVTYGDLQMHMKSQMTNIPGFTGNYFGTNNYSVLPRVHEFGGTIRQQAFSTELLAQTLMDVDTNPYSALAYCTQSYARFKQQLIQKVTQLHNTISIETPVYELVDTALNQINLGKPANSAFSNSDMLMYRDYESVNYTFVSGDTLIFDLPKTVNVYGDKKNHIQIWLKDVSGGGSISHWRPLVVEYDYEVSYDKVEISTIVSYNAGRAELHIRWYPINSSSFAPPSAVKLGILRPFVPEVLTNIDIDSTGNTEDVIIGHDGSIHKLQYPNQDLVNRSSAAFSIEDATIWELETRIYSNLSEAYNSVIDHNAITPSANRSTPYSYTDLVAAMEPEFLKWKTRNNISRLTTSDYYDANNKFTWNYNSVSPYIGGYKGLYTYFFNTERPHTHPWEMLGHNKKPLWWDDYYTWLNTANGGDTAKRTALITALKYGHYNSPEETTPKFSIHYSYASYDWSTKTLVTVAGVLNDPITADVVTTPALASRSTDFVFGDYGPIESAWRDSSYFHGSKINALMKLRPIWVLNSYFDSNRRLETSNTSLDNTQIIFANTKLLGNNKDANFSYSNYDDSIIEYITVRSGGSGYTSVPALTIYENFGRDAAAIPVVRNETIVAVSVQNPGEQYYSKPSVVASTGTATFDAFLLRGAKKYFNGLNNAIVEFALFNKTTVEELQARFKSLEYTPIVKANGFINPNNQQFILESSQNKGRVAIPEENYNSVLYTTQPDNEIFLGAVKITKAYNGYVINGYDNSKQYFNYYTPNTGTRQTIVTYNNLSVTKYRSYNSIPQRLYYNTTLGSLQEVYNLLLGYGKYLNDQGWADEWTEAAGNFIVWSSTAGIGSITNIIPNSSSISVNEGSIGYFDNINNKYEGVYNLIDSNGRQLTPNKVLIVRDLLETENPVTTISAKESTTQIYGVRLYKVNLEHAIVFDKTTSFDDVIYNPALGQLHTRIIWKGSRTRDWNGRLYSPGYIVTDNTIINNFDTTAREIDQVYAQGAILNNEQALDLARFNAGYNKPDWAIQLNTDNNTAFNFMQGTKKYRGTKFALDAFMRNTSLFGLAANVELHENWAIRTADYGDVRSRETLEFQVYKDLLKTSPQPIRFSETDTPDVLTDIVIDIDTNSPLLVTGTPGNNFTTRPAKTYNNTTISQEQVYANDFITAGLPLTTETDYKVINATDFAAFPTPNKPVYDFSGSWTSIKQWDNKTSYKYKDRVIYTGRTWEMLDPDGSSGLLRPNNPIELSGTISLPVIPTTGQTLIIDGNTVSISRTSTATTYNAIVVDGTNDISTAAIVSHGSTLILGQTSVDAQEARNTITFSSTTSSVGFSNIVIVGDVTNPQIVGGATKKLTLDGTDILFNDTISTTTNITAQAAFEDSFNSSWTINNTTVAKTAAATARITAIENLRVAYTGTWATFLATYFTNTAGLNITALLAEYNATPSYAAQIAALLTSDVTIINNIKGTSYIAANVLSGSETITPSHITDSQTAMNTGVYTNDISIWLQANTTTAFTTTTVVYTITAGSYKTYVLSEIVTKINAAGITNLTASTSSSRLVLTKTTLNNTVTFSFVITSATANAEVGITTTTTTYNSVGTTTTTTPNLTISQVIAQINAAGISGIVASQSTINPTRLRISSNNTTLYIGNGNANTVIGITAGQRVATTTITAVQTTSDLDTIVDAVNALSIYGVTARNSNNKLKLVSTNSTLVIGAGTANSTVGFTAQTYTATASSVSNVFNAIVGSDGNQVFRQMDYDPNLFSIWVADNSSSGEEYDGYAVYQSMDFGMYIYNACAGITAADDAQISVVMPAGVTQAHNLTTNDYVLIRGSTTVPSIDGIHRVTGVKNTSTFYIDVYLEEEGGTGNIYPLRNVRFASYTDLIANYNSILNGIRKYNFSGYRQNNMSMPIYAFVDNDDTGSPAVYRWQGNFNNTNGHYGELGWLKVRTSLPQARNDLIDSVKIYNSRQVLVQLETWDPAKGIIPGFIEEEIDFKTTADLANYNYNNVNGYTDNPKSWSSAQVGMRWWDISTAMYLDYEQGSIDYQQNNWGRLFDGASIDIYEWTQSPVLPDQWNDFVLRNGNVAGVAASGESYYVISNGEKLYQWTEEISYNPRTGLTTTTYYFWVKNKITYGNGNDYNIYQLANILKDPSAFDIAWCAASGSDYLFISSIDNYVGDDTVVQVNQTYESNALPLNEWTLLSNSDASKPVPEQLHIKMRDNIVGYNLNAVRYTYVDYSLLSTYSLNNVVLQDSKYYISLANSNIGHSPVVDTAQTYWRRIYEYSLPQDTPANDIDIVISKLIPDLSLHPLNRYGHLIRPQQSLFVDIVAARHNFIECANRLLKDICLVSDVSNWDAVLNSTFVEGAVTYDMSRYWNYLDWSLREYSTNNELLYEYDPSNLADIIVDSKFDIIPQMGDTTVYEEDTYVYVRNAVHLDNINRPEVYRYINSEWVLVWKKKGTIEFSEELWYQSKFGHGFDTAGFDISGFDSSLGNILGKIFDELRNRIFTGKHRVLYNKLWFACLESAVADTKVDDFAFKTTYVDIKVEHPVIENKPNYQRYSMDAVEQFFHSIKPFHTKLRSSIEAVTYYEMNDIEVSELSRTENITVRLNDHSKISWAADTILTGGDFVAEYLSDPYIVDGYVVDGYVEDGVYTASTEPLNVDGSTFTTTVFDYLYNGNAFIQPVEEGGGSELYPADFTENIRFRVQTNVSGSTATSDTRTFQMNYFSPYDIEESIAIVNSAKTTLNGAITASATSIVVTSGAVLNSSVSADNRGVVWIDNERIEYDAIDGNTLMYCTRGTRGTGDVVHSNGATVIDGGHKYRIPTLDNFVDYGNGLRMAYNDTGVSLSTAGITPEHAFIRNAGYGTV